MQKSYHHPTIESACLSLWNHHPEWNQPSTSDSPFTIVIPPPNVTGTLHIGHALQHALIDILVRIERLKGRSTLWIPGTDHAGIGTQTVVEKSLAKDGITKDSIGRDLFLDKIWEWKEQYGSTITSQMRRLGISVDWSRERFTMDDGCSHAVQTAFIQLHQQGLIYRGYYIVNWCPRCLTALSDIEVNSQAVSGSLWHIRYPLHSDPNQHIVVATTRPETLFGDQAIAIHPQDPRAQSWIGQMVQVPISGHLIPIIADEAVDPTFGTGAVKVTPAHDLTDFEISQRHQLSPKWIMSEHATMMNCPDDYVGLSREAARRQLIEALTNEGYLVTTQAHELNRGECYKCNTPIEPYLSKQWFVAMSKLAAPAIAAVESGDIKITPPRFQKLYFDWMSNIRDWCISRQIWWGHRIPVWTNINHPDDVVVAITPPNNGQTYTQDPDVLDTWFSSALWPFSTLGWPNQTEDLHQFYPTSTLVTGYDIITFWVSRMITMGLALTHQVPFKTVVVHGLVRDQYGKKMSKSFGNVVNPLELMDRYGADALRFALARLSTMGGQDIRYSEDKIEAAAHFANKVWNAARFVLMGQDPPTLTPFNRPMPTQLADQWILVELDQLIMDINDCHAQTNVAKMADRLWEFIWNEWCDWYLEMSKCHKTDSGPVLYYTLTQILIMLHPMMPFITESIWGTLVSQNTTLSPSISVATWPTPLCENIPKLPIMAELKAIVTELRRIRQELNIPPSRSITVVASAPSDIHTKTLALLPYIQKLAKVSEWQWVNELPPIDQVAYGVVDTIQLMVPLADLIDIDEERRRLDKKRVSLDTQLTQLQDRLNQSGFMQKAPSHVIQKLNDQIANITSERDALLAQLGQLS